MASHYLTGSRQRRGSLLSHPQAAPAPVPLVEPTDVYRAGGPFVLASVGFGAYRQLRQSQQDLWHHRRRSHHAAVAVDSECFYAFLSRVRCRDRAGQGIPRRLHSRSNCSAAAKGHKEERQTAPAGGRRDPARTRAPGKTQPTSGTCCRRKVLSGPASPRASVGAVGVPGRLCGRDAPSPVATGRLNFPGRSVSRSLISCVTRRGSLYHRTLGARPRRRSGRRKRGIRSPGEITLCVQDLTAHRG